MRSIIVWTVVGALMAVGCGTAPEVEDDGAESQGAALCASSCEPPEPSDPPPSTTPPPSFSCPYTIMLGQCVKMGSGAGSYAISTYNPCPFWAPRYTCTWYGACQCY